MSDTSFARFQALLSDIFQFDTGDLDFGIYRILNAKRQQVEAFIATDLQAVVDRAFADYAATKSEIAAGGLEAARAKVIANLGAEAFEADGQLSLAYQNTPVGKEYVREATATAHSTATDSLKEKVYNDLLTFFSRYYEDGDFLPLRRAGREMTYAVPYSGEEVLLHWANRGQYYVKTDDRLAAYRFRVAGGYHVSLEVRSARAEQNNNKGAKRFYLLADGDADGYAVDYDPDTRTLHVFFTSRPLTTEEAATYTGNSKQDAINQAVFDTVLARVKETGLRAALAAPYTPKEGEPAPATAAPTLSRHLAQFTKKNSADFFIHKNLSGFLTGELEHFVKTESLRLDDLLAASGGDFELLTARARATKMVGEKVIALLSSVEDFQRRLFEKRKFILRTDYVFTLDRVPASLHAAVLANAAQVQEWRDLYDVEGLLVADGVLGAGGLTAEALQNAPYNRLPVDTRHFDAAFKAELLASVDDLDALTDGVLFESENFQALNLLTEVYRERVKCVYIDPPYNTGGDGFLYKDAYQHSSWLSMMTDRLIASAAVTQKNTAIFVSIDDNEQALLSQVMSAIFGKGSSIGTFVWKRRQMSDSRTQTRVSTDHEYVLAFGGGETRFRGADIDETKYSNPDNDPRGGWYSDNLTGLATKEQRPNLHYDVTDPNTGTSYPPSPTRGWAVGKPRFQKLIDEKRILWPDNPNGRPRLKRFFADSIGATTGFSTVLDVGFTTDGTREVQNLFGSKAMQFPKPLSIVRQLVEQSTEGVNELVLDFFAGSGTTGHAVINLNREDDGHRIYCLVEMGEHFASVLMPRIKKAAFASKWSDGKPTSCDAISQTIKYHALEQYEDTLNNLRLRPAEQSQMAMDVYGEDYLLRYLLDFDTAGSASLLNVADLGDPFRYSLRVRAGDDFAHQDVDLPETFSYLLGLQVRRVRAFTDGEREYRAVLGTDRNGKAVAHIWRRSSDLAGNADALKQDAAFITGTVLPALSDTRPDRLFLNGAFAGIEGAENCEPDFLRLMFAPVGAV